MTPAYVEMTAGRDKTTTFKVAAGDRATVVTKTGKEVGVVGLENGAHVNLFSQPENDTGISLGVNLVPGKSNFIIIDNVKITPAEDMGSA